MKIKQVIRILASIVFLICFYSFLLGNKVFEKKFENDFVSWYILAKGIFCSSALYLLALVLEKLSDKNS